jgi:hypothetical protein
MEPNWLRALLVIVSVAIVYIYLVIRLKRSVERRRSTQTGEDEVTEYIQRKDGEGFAVPIGEIYRIACCDCGLVHDVGFAYEDGKLAMAAKRNNTETELRRGTITNDVKQ